jgi:hypothetical protein
VSDFLTELRSEVLAGHAAHQNRSRSRRAARALVARPAPALAVAAVVVALVGTVVALRALATPEPVAPRVLEVVRLGGVPTDAIVAEGSVWVADASRSEVARIDVATRRVVTRAPVEGQPIALAWGDGRLWVRSAVGRRTQVQRIPGGRVTPVGFGTSLAAGPEIIWAPAVELPPEGLHRIGADNGRDRGLIDVRGVYALAAAGEALWAVTNNGTVLRLDSRTGEVRHRWPAVAISAGTEDPPLVADARGAWVMRVGQGADTQVIRIEGDRVARRLPVDPDARPVIAAAPGGLWIAVDAPLGRGSAALRLDPETGRPTARVELGRRTVVAMEAVGDLIWVLASDGSLLVVGPGN